MNELVSIIIPCRNEAAHIAAAVRDALAQGSRRALEVLVAVGPSTDGTERIVERLATQHPQVHVVPNPAGVVPHGLNAAIRASHGAFIVRMDAHSRYPPDYVQVLVDALERTGADNVGGVWETLPANDSNEAWAIAQALSSPFGVGNAMFRLGVEGEREVDTVPYGCFRRSLFDRIGYFDEELVRNQDDEHNGRIIRAGGRIILLPQVVIRYFPRDRITKLWRMYREYGLFKPLVNLKLGSPATLRQFVPPLFVLGLMGVPVLAVLVALLSMSDSDLLLQLAGVLLWANVALIAAVLLYVLLLFAVSLRTALRGGRLRAFGFTVAAFATVHVAYGWGYLQGLVRFVLLGRRIRPDQVRTNR